MSSLQYVVTAPAKQRRGTRTTGAPREFRRARVALPPSAAIGLFILMVLAAGAVLGPILWPVSPDAQELGNRLAAPWGFGGSAAHPLGTDSLGRDTLARLIAGARVSLPISIIAALAAGAIGVGLGILAGYRGGWIDRMVTWLSDVQLAIPFVVFAIVVTATFGNSIGNVLTTLIVTGWVAYARVIRLQARAMRGAAWMEAAKGIGGGPVRLLTRHLLPNLAPVVAVLATQQAGAMILYESSLSFLGLGLGGSVVTWGGMAALGRDAIFKAPWVAAIPGAAIALAILGFNLTGDWLATRGRRQGWM
ncbi:MAG: ABC transporter permease [Chloroflexota bacterium]|nr:ABC transporter permease [Chloroflexota bacterium]